jgi:hypothetical protein
MIINSVIPGQRQRVASLATYPEGTSKYVVAEEGSTVELDFLYSNTSSFAGKAIYYADGVEEDTQDLTANDDYSWDVTSLLTEPGLYQFKIVLVDTNGNGTKIEFTVFYGFNLEDFTFSYDSDLGGYVLVSYSGTSADVVIPSIFDDEDINGEKNVVRIGNGAFFDNDTMETVVVPDTVQSIGATAFFSCSVLESFEIDRNTPPTLEANNVLDAYSPLLPLKIYVPSASVAAYKSATNWIEYQNAIFAIS